MTDTAIVSAAIMLSSGMIFAAVVWKTRSRGQWAELVADEIRVILDARDEIHKARRAVEEGTRAVAAQYADNHQVLRELLKREQELMTREQALEVLTFRETG